MKCPVCGSETKVIDSRLKFENVYRRRECLGCKARFSTNEIIFTKSIKVPHPCKTSLA